MTGTVIKLERRTKTAIIDILEPIGENWFGDGLTGKKFAGMLKDVGDVDNIHLRINSPGGNVFDGVAIYNLLKQHKATVDVNIIGMALSAASVIAQAGDSINMAHNAMFMVHDPWSFAMGNSREMRDAADLLDKIKGTLVDTYARSIERRKGASDAELIALMMEEETWLTADEAKDHGFVDEITDDVTVEASWDLTKFKNPPEQALAMAGPAAGLRGKLALNKSLTQAYAMRLTNSLRPSKRKV